MELRHIRYFVAIAEAGTITQAAKELHISQPALSRQIRDLEREIGLVLLERSGRNVRLTDAGRELLIDGHAILQQAAAFQDHARELRTEETGILHVGASPQMLERLIPDILQTYGASFPNIVVRLHEGSTRTLESNLREGQIHLVVTIYQPEWAHSARQLSLSNILAISRSDVPIQSQIELTELADQNLLVLKPGFVSRDFFEAACRLAHIHPIIAFESGSTRTLQKLAEAGYGTAIIPTTMVVEMTRASVRPIAHDGKIFEIPIAVHWNPLRNLPQYAIEFIDILDAQAHGTLTSELC